MSCAGESLWPIHCVFKFFSAPVTVLIGGSTVDLFIEPL